MWNFLKKKSLYSETALTAIKNTWALEKCVEDFWKIGTRLQQPWIGCIGSVNWNICNQFQCWGYGFHAVHQFEFSEQLLWWKCLVSVKCLCTHLQYRLSEIYALCVLSRCDLLMRNDGLSTANVIVCFVWIFFLPVLKVWNNRLVNSEVDLMS